MDGSVKEHTLLRDAGRLKGLCLFGKVRGDRERLLQRRIHDSQEHSNTGKME